MYMHVLKISLNIRCLKINKKVYALLFVVTFHQQHCCDLCEEGIAMLSNVVYIDLHVC